jgi:hypothetical protein
VPARVPGRDTKGAASGPGVRVGEGEAGMEGVALGEALSVAVSVVGVLGEAVGLGVKVGEVGGAGRGGARQC